MTTRCIICDKYDPNHRQFKDETCSECRESIHEAAYGKPVTLADALIADGLWPAEEDSPPLASQADQTHHNMPPVPGDLTKRAA